jgi:hypothetical protein
MNRYKKIIKDSPTESSLFVKRNMDILDRIHYLLNKKFDGKQKLLADKMGKTEAEVSRMINGLQNFTQKTIIKLELAFGEHILAVVTSDQTSDCTYELVASDFFRMSKSLSCNQNGKIQEDFIEVGISDSTM